MKVIQQIFHDHASEYLATHWMSSSQRKVLNAICKCRTPDAGQHIFICPDCSEAHVANSSCGNRHYHPHIHYVVAGGGLSIQRHRWIHPRRGNFLVHVRALSAVFKGKFRAELAKCGLLQSVPGRVWQKDWVVHCKSVGNGQRALTYLGAYVFRVTISNARIVDYDGKRVTFKYYRVASHRARTCTLDATEFIRRYLQHALPKAFMKVRHYGFLSRKCSVAIEQIRNMIALATDRLRRLMPPEPPDKLKPLTCPSCSAVMKWYCFIIGSRKILSSP